MRVLLADDQFEVRSALRLLLEQELQAEVVGEAASAASLLSRVELARPDLVILDWELPGKPGAKLVGALRARWPHLAIVVLSVGPEVGLAALAAGADAFVSKAEPPSNLVAVLPHCTAADQWGPPANVAAAS